MMKVGDRMRENSLISLHVDSTSTSHDLYLVCQQKVQHEKRPVALGAGHVFQVLNSQAVYQGVSIDKRNDGA